jgi:hypothetical protein
MSTASGFRPASAYGQRVTGSIRFVDAARVQYCVRAGTKCVYDQGRETFIPGEEEKVVRIDAAYLELHVSFVRDRARREWCHRAR